MDRLGRMNEVRLLTVASCGWTGLAWFQYFLKTFLWPLGAGDRRMAMASLVEQDWEMPAGW